MMITYEQAHLAVSDIIDNTRAHVVTQASCRVPSHVITAAIQAAESAPDVRNDRIAEARSRLSAGLLDADDIAEMILNRIAADSMR